MANKKPKKEAEAGLCRDCWRWQTFKNNCIYFWDNKSECSKFMKHQMDEERYVRKNLV